MKEFQERRLFRNLFFSRIVFALFLCGAIFLALAVYEVYKKGKHAVLRNEVAEKEVSELENRKNQLQANLDGLRTEFGVEKELRERFQIKKPGEDYVIILKDQDAEQEPPQKEENGFFKKIINWFKRD
ncbi:MAG: hypothetical protein ABII97_00625 [Patescibacteria group bacterium]